MIEIKAPNKWEHNQFTIFLAGSIEMGKAINWQQQVVNKLKDLSITLLNPRRDDWDSSWVQSIHNAQFCEQVVWELDAQEGADAILMYFDKDTKSPITLLELGLFCPRKKMIVCCPDGFWRKGNVEIVCDRFDIPCVNTIEEMLSWMDNKGFYK